MITKLSHTNSQIVVRLIVFNAFFSDPSCTDIMEIYNAVEEMDDDEEVSTPE